MEQQRKDIRPEETLILPWIVGVPDYSSGVMFNFEMEYIQYREPYLYVILSLAGSVSVRRDLPGPDTEDR